MKLIDLIQALEEVAPLTLQESYDNSGLAVGNHHQEITGALVTVDVTEEVLQEAVSTHCNLVISHHPLIFSGIKRITGNSPVERMIEIAIKRDIAVYAMHTNLDNLHTGINHLLASKIGLEKLKILRPTRNLLRKLATFCPQDQAEQVREAIFKAGAGHIGNYDSCSFNTAGTGSFRGSEDTNPFAGIKGVLHFEPELRIETIFPAYLQQKVLKALFQAHPYEEVAYDIYPLENEFSQTGAGIIGELRKTLPEIVFLEQIKQVLGSRCLRHSRLTGRQIRKVAVCGGSGSFLIPDAIRAGADAYLTGDMKYHDFFDADDQLVIADAGHFETEQFAKELIAGILNKKFPTFAVLISEVPTNPVNYL